MTEGNEGKVTDAVITVAALGLLAYEVFTIFNRRKGDTISESVWRATARRPLVPLLFGILTGHFFWQRDTNVTIETEKVEVK